MTGSEATFHGLPYADAAGPSVQLSVYRGPEEGQPVDCRRVVTLIGSRAGCKLRLDHPLVSPVHAALVNDGVDVYAVDLVSSRGTKLNDLRMEYERLKDGDVLTIEPWAFRVGLRGQGSSADTPSRGLALEFAPSIVALEHMDSGRVLKPHRRVCTIGRRSACDIQVDDTGVSRAHALLFTQSDHPVIVDLLSSNGTFVNDEPAPFRSLADGDVVRVGETQFRVRIVVPTAAEPKTKSARGIVPNGSAPSNPASNGRAAPAKIEDDLVDIQSVEGSQRWHIADKLDKPNRKRRVAQ